MIDASGELVTYRDVNGPYSTPAGVLEQAPGVSAASRPLCEIDAAALVEELVEPAPDPRPSRGPDLGGEAPCYGHLFEESDTGRG